MFKILLKFFFPSTNQSFKDSSLAIEKLGKDIQEPGIGQLLPK